MENNAQNESMTSQPSDSCFNDLISTNLKIIDQLTGVLHIFSPQQYIEASGVKISSIGAHTRHIIEFYQAFFSAVQNTQYQVLCYDNRQRNMLFETSKDAALQELFSIKKKLISLCVTDMDMQVSAVIVENKPLLTMGTTLNRELFYLLDHMIHHMALIKMLAEKQEVMLDEGFGLAQSTKVHESSKK